MLDFSFGEILVVAVIAVIFLGPDKLPQAFVNVAKFFKSIRKIINDAKDTIDKEIRISEIKKEAIEYKKKFDEETSKISSDITNDIDFGISDVNSILNQNIDYESTTSNTAGTTKKKENKSKNKSETSNKKAMRNLKQRYIDKEFSDEYENVDSNTIDEKAHLVKQNSNKSTKKNKEIQTEKNGYA